jgi:hypothetical protein
MVSKIIQSPGRATYGPVCIDNYLTQIIPLLRVATCGAPGCCGGFGSRGSGVRRRGLVTRGYKQVVLQGGLYEYYCSKSN